ncbi:MAG TPA: 50S ribosomal protein L23 [Treponema sp.]|jgi:large subunit ribosomal protein L23|uniref:50S ribosomal protein L23 n=1 Tax=Gracilinema caldarium TaxID=215591 RepID=UPI0026F20151|nr:50S ribosomal protein L23 [Gracilinema caldarium]HON13210.1 50S ribosomal protein L23 [Treponema sp.]HPC70546.1 50S ribosomal protein L23 [Treponema sp.]HRS03775.1 50S ribosomal protein L23 [Treponema sp.]HRU28170.1 50S ribosomal protein L23 [Treponema sp.]
MTYEQILIEPVLSEKTNRMREEGKYVFKVDPSASKIQIKEAVRKLFNVHPISCTVMVVGGKPKRVRYKAGYTSSWKKAIVRLPKDEKIALFEGV